MTLRLQRTQRPCLLILVALTAMATVARAQSDCPWSVVRGAFLRSGREHAIAAYDFFWESVATDALGVLNDSTLDYTDLERGVLIPVSVPSRGVTMTAFVKERKPSVVDVWWLDDPAQMADAKAFLVDAPRIVPLTLSPEDALPVPTWIRRARAAGAESAPREGSAP